VVKMSRLATPAAHRGNSELAMADGNSLCSTDQIQTFLPRDAYA